MIGKSVAFATTILLSGLTYSQHNPSRIYYTVYNNTPLQTDWLYTTIQDGLRLDTNCRLSKFTNIEPGHSFIINVPQTEFKDDFTVGIWGTVTPDLNWPIFTTYLNALSGIVPSDQLDKFLWYHEAEEGEPHLLHTLPKGHLNNVGAEDKSELSYYMTLRKVHANGVEEILHPLCRWINAGASIEERSERARVYSRVLEQTALGVSTALHNGQRIGASTPVFAFIFGLQLDETNQDWHGIRIAGVPFPNSIWGDSLPWQVGDTILEFNGEPVFNKWQLNHLLTKHVTESGIEHPCKILVITKNDEYKEYLVSYRYNEDYFKHFISAHQARMFVVSEDSLIGPTVRAFVPQMDAHGNPMSYDQKQHWAKETKMFVYQAYPNAAKQGSLLSWVVPSPLKMASVVGKLGKVEKVARAGSRASHLIRDVAIIAAETTIGTYLEPMPFDDPAIKREAAGRAITSALVLEAVTRTVTRRK